jgi:hypothetical protein
MVLSNFLLTPNGVLKNTNSGDPEPDGPTPGCVQIRRLEDGTVVRNDWAIPGRMKNPGSKNAPMSD